MSNAIGFACVCKRERPVLRWRAAKLPPECAGKRFVIGESDRKRDPEYIFASCREPRSSPLEPQSLRILLRRFTDVLTEHPLQVEPRSTRPLAECIERQISVQTLNDRVEQVGQFVGGLHGRGKYRQADIGVLDVSCYAEPANGN